MDYRGIKHLDPHREFLELRIAEQPDLSMMELSQEMAERGVKIDQTSLSRWYRRNGYSFKKSILASEQNRPDVAAARYEWITKRQPLMRQVAHRLIFVDGETATAGERYDHEDGAYTWPLCQKRAPEGSGSVRALENSNLYRRLAQRGIDRALCH